MTLIAVILATVSMASASPERPPHVAVASRASVSEELPAASPGTSGEATPMSGPTRTARFTVSTNLGAYIVGDLSLQLETRIHDQYAAVVYAAGYGERLSAATVGGRHHFRSFERGWFAGVDVGLRDVRSRPDVDRRVEVGPRGGWKITSDSGVTFAADLGMSVGSTRGTVGAQMTSGVYLGYSL